MYRIDPESREPGFCAPTASAALRALSVTVTQLHAHMQSSQHQQRLPVVYAPVMSDIQRLSDTLEAKVTASQEADDDAAKTVKDSKLNGLVKAFKSSFRRRDPKGSPAPAEPPASDPTSQGVQADASPSRASPQDAADGNNLRRQSVVAQGLAELQSSREGEQCLLKALLQQEGMRVLENCLTACLHLAKPQ